MATKIINCKDCQEEFEFTEGEQEFFKLKKFSDPVRCKSCRNRRKAEKNEGDNI